MEHSILELLYNHLSSSFSELLEKDKSVTKYHRNQETVAYEIFKVKNNMAPEILTETFRQNKIKYNLTNTKALLGRRIKTVMYGSETKLCLGSTIWNILLTELKDIVFPKLFKMKIREWAPKNCPSQLYKIYVQNIGFL